MRWRREEENLEGERRGGTHEIERREGDSRGGQERRRLMRWREETDTCEEEKESHDMGGKETHEIERKEGDS